MDEKHIDELESEFSKNSALILSENGETKLVEMKDFLNPFDNYIRGLLDGA